MITNFLATILMSQSTLKADRVDMGIRLRRLDAAWVKASDERKKFAVNTINGSVMGFFTGNFGDVCRGLDFATADLNGTKPTARESLIFRVRPQIYEPGEEVEVTIGWAYDNLMEPLAVKWEGHEFQLKPGETVKRKVQTQVRMMPMIYPPIHTSVRGKEDFEVNGLKLDSGSAWLVNARRFETMRLAESSPWAGVAQLMGTARSEGIESPFAVADSVARMDSVLPEKQSELSPVYARSGDTLIRVCAPDAPFGKLASRKKVMIVLHGAGGSLDMFPESYGAGRFVKRAVEDGWLVLSPQANGGSVMACREWMEKQGIKPEKLVVAGHSMGGGIALMAAADDVDAIVAFAPAGGKAPEGIPFFVAVGAHEMAMIKGTAEALGKKATEFKTYANAEHLMVVAEATDDAWAFVKRVTER